MVRQTDNIRITSRCYEPTKYPWDEDKKAVKPTCVYLKDGECSLLCCVRRGDKNAKTNLWI